MTRLGKQLWSIFPVADWPKSDPRKVEQNSCFQFGPVKLVTFKHFCVSIKRFLFIKHALLMSSRCMPSLPHNSLYLFKTVCNSKKPTDFEFNNDFFD